MSGGRSPALSGKGVQELLSSIYQYKAVLDQGHALETKMKQRIKVLFLRALEAKLMAHFMDKMEIGGQFDSISQDLLARRIDPYTAAEQMIAAEFSHRNQ